MSFTVSKQFAIFLFFPGFFLFFPGQSALAQPAAPKLEFGPQFSLLKLSYHFNATEGAREFVDDNWFSYGGWVTYNLTNQIALEASIEKFKTDEITPRTFSNAAQPDVQGLFGVKAGWRREKFGVFGKLRPGFTKFTPVFDCPAIDFSTCTQESHTGFSLDVGGVIEGYLSRRFLVRGDLGAVYLRHPETRLFFGGEPGTPPFQFSSQGFKKFVPKFSVGFGVRF